MATATLLWVTILGSVSGSWVHMPSLLLQHRVRPPTNIRLSADAGDNAAAANDALIGQMRASTPEELPKLLADNLKQIDQRLFLRLAEMSDGEEDEYEKLRIRQLATLVASTLETILEQADALMDADAELVQGLLRTMASEAGEFEVPVPAARLDALRTAIRERSNSLDEGFVGTVKAYMKKASDDGLEGMVDVLRALLQVFAAERLRALAGGEIGTSSSGAQAAIVAALDASPEDWDTVLRAQVISDSASCGPDELVGLLQDKMGEVVLQMPAGSAVQSVLAEYLNELIGCARTIAAEDV